LFSAFSISLSVLGFSPIAGVILICFSVLLGVVRFLGGVHYIIDLIFGAFTGIISGLVVLFLI
jgi:membrane-associated phospholipid phosphatase